MNKGVLLAVALMASACRGPRMNFPESTNPYFPRMTVENLNREALVFPSQLPGDRTLLLLAFEQRQQASVDAWVAGMNLGSTSIAWLELPVIDDPGAIGRWFVDNGMRRGIPSPEARGRVFTVYTERSAFLKAMGIESTRDVLAVVVDRSGRIVARRDGTYEAEKSTALFDALLEGR